ncbi:MAG: hypothetical protein U1F63_06045 [Chitinivorax sp.]
MQHITPILALPLLLMALPALAGEAPIAHMPAHAKPGDFREYNNTLMGITCSRWEFTEVTDAGEVLNQCGDKTMVLSTDFDLNPMRISDGTGTTLVEFKPFYPQLSYPLTLGKEWSGEYSGYTADNDAHWDSKVNCKVEAFEKLQVIAGEFDTFRIACVDHWRAGLLFSGETHSTRWYAPKTFSIIKVVHDKAKWNTELVNYQIQ